MIRNWMRKLFARDHTLASPQYDPYQQMNVFVEGSQCVIALDEPIDQHATIPLPRITLDKQQLFQAQRLLHNAYVEMLTREILTEDPAQAQTRPLEDAQPETDPGMWRVPARKSWRSVSTDRDLSWTKAQRQKEPQ